ncbi:hypothetical protein GCM10025868_25630 [Angustibacter aerolatus]|uniref:LysR substrate-binding domain-containing protein n=1 Tax=Angustibacter aerolatus TaxID=1162965 RepID=A0ABQ6JGJ7_9ACTN|nr:hypothetical protein GCM10025868_25630 [Angustibacter aerolatus]
MQSLVAAGLGVGLLPSATEALPGVEVIGLREPEVLMRWYAVTRRGTARWAPLALVVDRLAASSA